MKKELRKVKISEGTFGKTSSEVTFMLQEPLKEKRERKVQKRRNND